MKLPQYLKRRRRKKQTRIGKVTNDYRPILGAWLIEIALMLEWYKPDRSGSWPDIFSDDDFLLLTGLPAVAEEDDDEQAGKSGKFPTVKTCRQLLEQLLISLEKIKVPDSLKLFDNIALLSELLGLNEAEQCVLAFAAALNLFPAFRNAIAARCEKTTNQLLCEILSRISGVPENEFRSAISGDGILISTSLIRNSKGVVDLEEKLDLFDGLSSIMLMPHHTVEELAGKFLRKASPPSLALENFPHLKKDITVMRDYLSHAMKEKTTGVNILLHGKPGVGKTEFAQSLVHSIGVELYEISFSDSDGDPIKGTARLRAFNFSQHLLARTSNAVLMFDEIEDVFPCDYGLFSLQLTDGEKGKGSGKAWINRAMERNPVPAIWISNQVSHIDPAYLRRFDYSVMFPVPPVAVRRSIAGYHLGCFDLPCELIDRIVSNDSITPGQLDRAAKVARIVSSGDNARALDVIEQTLERSTALLGQKRAPGRNVLRTAYNIEFLNTDIDITPVINGLKRRPRGSFCFYGPAGTGKSELARYMSDELGKPFLLKRASDILSMWVGESEKNIAAMFSEASQQDAVLVLDEADSFLADRRVAQRSWEVTQVNELLTQMEAFEGVFVCTTNLMDALDQACLRRFTFKVRFSPLTSDQRWRMFLQELSRLGGDNGNIGLWEAKVRNLESLTPGDFAVASRQFELWEEVVLPERLYDQILKECEAKGPVKRSIGFGS